jgi:hypothetical protein
MIASNGEDKFVGHIVLDVPAKNPTFNFQNMARALAEIVQASEPQFAVRCGRLLRGGPRHASSMAGVRGYQRLSMTRVWRQPRWSSLWRLMSMTVAVDAVTG